MANKLNRPFVDGRKQDKPGSGLVQIWPSVPVEVRRAAEQVAGANLAAGQGPRDVNGVFRAWLVQVVVILNASSPADVRRAAATIRGETPRIRKPRIVTKRAPKLPMVAGGSDGAS